MLCIWDFVFNAGEHKYYMSTQLFYYVALVCSPQVIFLCCIEEGPVLLIVSCSKPVSINAGCSCLRLCGEVIQQ